MESLPETVTLSTAAFQSRTEAVYKDQTVIDIQLLGAGLLTERVLKAGLKSPQLMAVVMLLFPMSLEFHPSLYILCRL